MEPNTIKGALCMIAVAAILVLVVVIKPVEGQGPYVLLSVAGILVIGAIFLLWEEYRLR